MKRGRWLLHDRSPAVRTVLPLLNRFRKKLGIYLLRRVNGLRSRNNPNLLSRKHKLPHPPLRYAPRSTTLRKPRDLINLWTGTPQVGRIISSPPNKPFYYHFSEDILDPPYEFPHGPPHKFSPLNNLFFFFFPFNAPVSTVVSSLWIRIEYPRYPALSLQFDPSLCLPISFRLRPFLSFAVHTLTTPVTPTRPVRPLFIVPR